jgi:tripartite motif-containing protein 71
MKGKICWVLTFCVLIYLSSAKEIFAEELVYSRSAATAYAEKWCNQINDEKFKEFSGNDCANFVSQAVMAGFGAFDKDGNVAGNPFGCVKGAPIIGKDGSTKGIAVAGDLGTALGTSFCFKTVNLSEAKEGDIVTWSDKDGRVYHSGVLNGEGYVATHSNSHCFGEKRTPSWVGKNYTIYQFQDSDKCKTCKRDETTCSTEMKDKCSETESCNPETGSCTPKCSNFGGSYDAELGICLAAAGNDYPDDTSDVGAGNPSLVAPTADSLPSVGVIKNGFAYEMAGLLESLKENVSIIKPADVSPVVVEQTPLLIIPSGGLYGMENSVFFKTALEEYVKGGGTILVLSQQHGYEYSVIPGGLAGYGWLEDQSCQVNSSFVDAWHPVLAGQTRSTPSFNVDGYFTQYPENTTVLLRRTSNGQPSLVIYPYGKGYVIASTIYFDTSYKRGAASKDEKGLIRDIITWAKLPAPLQEIRPGNIVSLTLAVTNNDAYETATAAEIEIYDPDKKEVKLRAKVSINLAPGQSAQIPLTYTTSSTDPLGIYHIKYGLLTEGYQLLTSEMDPDGENVWLEYLLQPPMEEPSGRFVVSSPPSNPYKSPDFSFSVQSDNEYYLYGSPATFTFNLWNHTETERTITVKGNLSHHRIWIIRTVTIPPKGSTSFNYILGQVTDLDRCFTWFYDESGKQVGLESKGIWMVWPSASVTVTTGKNSYAYGKGETVKINASFKNNINIGWQSDLKVRIMDANNNKWFEETTGVNFLPFETRQISTSFTLSPTAFATSYTVRAEVIRGGTELVSYASTRFEVPLSQISVTPNLSSPLPPGTNTIPFTISNTGKVNVSSGAIDLYLKAPDGSTVYSGTQAFSLAAGENNSLAVPISIPSLEFGQYTLTYSESDETKTGNPTSILIPNTVSIAFSFDKPSYRVRDTAILTLELTNSGKFNLDNGLVTVSAPSLDYTETKTASLLPTQSLQLTMSIPIPETISGGQHYVDVTFSIPSGAEFTKRAILSVPASKLVIDYSGGSTLKGGDVISLTVENQGGADTSYTTEKFSITDSKGIIIYQTDITGEVFSGEKKILAEVRVPSQIMNGWVFVSVQMLDSKTGEKVYFSKALDVVGLTASLNTRTDKEAYLKTEAITGITSLANGPYGIEGGSLKLAVVRNETSQFLHFLPKTGWWPFYTPRGVAVGPDGSVYVADTDNDQIQKFDSNGNFITKWGRLGFGDGEFAGPEGVAVGPDGSVYVSDYFNDRIQKFDSSGNFITKWGNYCAVDVDGDGIPDQACKGDFYYPLGISVGPDGSVYVTESFNHRVQKFDSDGAFVTGWGSLGSGEGQFNIPRGIAVDSQGFVYVVDSENSRIQKFDSQGTFIVQWGGFGSGNGEFYYPGGIAISPDNFVYVADVFQSCIHKFDLKGNFIMKWGSQGNGDGQFNGPESVAVGTNGSVYVADFGNDRIQEFDDHGNFMRKWGSGGNGEGQFFQPEGIAVNPEGYIYVADTDNRRIQKFGPNGDFITRWGNYGAGDGEFCSAMGIAIAPDSSVYAVDSCNHRIQRFGPDGAFVTKWGKGCIVDIDGDGVPDQPCDGEFYYPSAIAIAPDGSVYVAEWSNNRIQKFDSNGNFITKWGASGTGQGEFQWPSGITIGPDGSVFVTDSFNNRVQKFDSNGNFIAEWGSWGAGNGRFSFPEGIAAAPDGSVYVTDSDRIQKFSLNGDFIAQWGRSGSGDGEFHSPGGIAIGPDGTVYVADTYNNRIQKMNPSTFFEGLLPINQTANTAQDYITNIGTLNATGKLYLQAALTNSLGQVIAESSYPFYIFEGNTFLLFSSDKKIYRPGELVTVTAQVENHAPISAVGLTFSLTSKSGGQTLTLFSTEAFDIPAGGSRQITVTTTAGAEGTVALTGVVIQNNFTLIEIKDQFEVAVPNLSVSVLAPDIVGNEPFFINVEIRNTGKVEGTIQLGIESTAFGDSQAIMISPGETKIVQYAQQLTSDMNYTFTFTGDLDQSITKTVFYGLSASLQLGAGIQDLGVYPEGKILVPVTIINTGQLDETLEAKFELSRQSSILSQQSRTYFILKGMSVTDSLYFDLSEGNYQITVSSQLPTTSAQASFSVRKENRVGINLALGAQSEGMIPVNVNLTNNGFNAIEGTVQLSAINSDGATLWNSSQEVSLLSSSTPSPSTQIFNINPSALPAGEYTLKAEILNNSNQEISFQSSSFEIQSATFQITQLPPYQVFSAGQEATFTFRVKNTGNQEGPFDLRLKAYDLIDLIQREWLSPGEEKSLTFSFMLPEDLEEKDYFASYELKDSRGVESSRGQIKYHLAGINLNVNATLDKPYYAEGETAHLTLNIQSTNPNPQSFFARVNYNGFESQQPFTLSGSQAIFFDIPLPQITGEKLFYGIYHESGRSIHLNSLYIHKQGDVLTIATDKQVYNLGDLVSVTVSGNASGSMTLSGPGGYEETFAFTGSATKAFVLPLTMTAGTYYVNAQLVASNPGTITVSQPFDVAGLQVKVLECQNDKGKYASSDTITTNFTIFSNKAMPAVLKTWIVDPKGQYTSGGENPINLSSTENLLVTYSSPLATSLSGIHRLTYGIYSGSLLLVSGSEAFDVGDAILLGISTDKRDYPTNTESVNVTLSLFGSVNADLQLELDGNVVKSESITLNGFLTYTTQLQNITPGPHTLKATLTAGGLKSTKETSFTYALAYMPKPQISASPASFDFGNINLGSTSTKTGTLLSIGNVDLVIGMISLSGTNQGEFSLVNDNCSGRTIIPSENCTLGILFSPTSLGTKTGSLSIPSNATTTPTLSLRLSGTGITTLNLSINPIGGGRVTGTGIDCPGDCAESFSTSGATIQLNAAPTEGYRFVNWTGDINRAENPVAINMDTNRNVTANFAINTYTVTATAGSGGAILPSGPVSVSHGGSQTFIITPNSGYHVTDVKVDGASVGAVTLYTFNNVTLDHIIEAIFVINQYTIIATAGSNGTISPSGTLIVNHGGSQTFTITPNPGYHVADVKIDGISAGALTTFRFDNVISNRTIEVTFEVDNSPPVADAGLDQNVITGQVVTLNGSKSYDPEGAMITFLWTFIEVPLGSSVTNASLSDATSAKPQFTPAVSGAYRLQLIVNDGALNSLPDEVVINATTPNVPPNSNAGPDQNVVTGSTVQLDGSRSNDPDNGPLPLSYLWSFAAKPAGSLLTDNQIVNGNMSNANFIPDVDGLYELKLTVNDGNLSSEDTVQIMATVPNVPPNANAGEDFTIYLGQRAILDGSKSNDPDKGPELMSYTWSVVAVPTGSQLTNGAISGANAVSPSFTPDVVGTYVLQLMVFDGRDAAFDNVAVTAIKPQIPPTTSAALSPLPNGSGWNNSNVTVTLSATDASGLGVKEISYTATGAQPIPITTKAGSSASLTIWAEGRTSITFFATDKAGNIENGKTVVINLDKTAPTISCSASPSLLWPPNHKMVTITVKVNMSDSGSGAAGFKLVSVTSNEPDDGLGDGDLPNDIQGWVAGSPSVNGQLRAERSGKGTGRKYSLTYMADDAAGNHGTCVTTVIVPHDQGK